MDFSRDLNYCFLMECDSMWSGEHLPKFRGIMVSICRIEVGELACLV